MQKLAMPFVKQMMLCGYKNKEYKKHWGYDHYGVDISTIQGGAGDDPTIYASGDGEIIACGWDNSGGNVIVMKYFDAFNHNTGLSADVVARYMHLEKILCKVGQKVKLGTVLGVEGKTKTGDYHLHIEFDSDARYKYACWSPQVSSADDKKPTSSGNILIKGTDSTINPSYLFHAVNKSDIVEPTYNPAWLNAEDFVIPILSHVEDVVPLKQYEDMVKDRDALKERLDACENKLDKIKDILGVS